jgi:PAS domain S-box-containing protein
MTFLSAYLTTQRADSWLSFSPGCVELPLLLWLSAWYPPVFALSSASLMSIIVIGATAFGIGRFGDASIPIIERVQGAQLTVTMVTAFTLVLIALFSERRSQQDLLSANNKRLRHQEEAFRRLLGALPAAIYTADSAGHITYCNQAAVDLWGRRPELGKDKWSDLCRLRYADGTSMPLEDCATQICLQQRRAVVGQETILVRPDGSTIPFIPYPAPLLDEKGAVVGVVNMKVDITERKRAEHALAERNLQLSLAGKAALVGSYSYDAGAEVMDVSEGYAAVHGLPEGTTKTTRREWRTRAHPDDLRRVEELREQAFREHRDEYSVEYRIVGAAGEVRWIESRSFISYAANGRPLRVVGVNIDITDRKRAEAALSERNAQLELAGKFARVGSFAVDYAANRIRLSPGCATLYGLPEDTVELSPGEARSRVYPSDIARVDAARNRAFRERRQDLIAQFRIVRADNGEIRWVESRSLISYNNDGQPTRMVGVGIDVTARKHAEDHKSLLISELDHRVKNTLACVGAIVEQTHNTNNSMDGFLDALRGRLRSLANTHALLSHNRWEGVGLAEIVHGELAPCMRDDNTLVEGPAIDLTADSVQTVAIVLHELVTNATKYGALSNGRGRVSVRWDWHSNEHLHDVLILEWRETGGPSARAPLEAGYGTSVIRDLIPYELGGTVDYTLAPDGVRCRLEIPAKWLRISTKQRPIRRSAEPVTAVL